MNEPQRETVDLMVVNASELVTGRAPWAPGLRGVRGEALEILEVISDGAVAIRDGRIVAVGSTEDLARRYASDEVIDARGTLVSPGLVDPHTHLVHAGSRHHEWEQELRGLPAKSSASGATVTGIAATIRDTQAAETSTLRESLVERLDVMLEHGTTATEVKSGYGITAEHEVRLLEVIESVDHAITIVPTYLGAHTLPADLVGDRDAAVEFVTSQIPLVRDLAQYVDICCEPGGYTQDEVRRIAAVAEEHGLRMRLHADHAAGVGGVDVAVEVGAASVDHLEHASAASMVELGRSDTVAVLCPGVSFHLGHLVPSMGVDGPVPPKHPELGAHFRRIVAAGAVVALSTDYNPGSAPTLSMQVVMQLAARLYGFSAAQIWHMCTINAAVSLDLDEQIGSLDIDKAADLVIWSVPHHQMVVHRFGANLVRIVVKDGHVAWSAASGPRGRPDAAPDLERIVP